jgi:hypothetical protein
MMGRVNAVNTIDAPGDGSGWQSPRTMPRRWLALAFAVSAVFGLIVALVSSNELHQTWGIAAACSYGLAAVAVLAWRSRGVDLALLLALCGGLLAPLLWLAGTHQQQPEVTVIARSAVLLIHHGTPYESDATLAVTKDPNAYDPYLPVMALFGLPKAIFGSNMVTDPRIWFGLVFAVLFWLGLRAGGALEPGRWAVLIAASPIMAFQLAVGGDDVPMVACLCLGYGLLWRKRPVAAGLALGIGAAMKATAWPAPVIGIATAYVAIDRRAAWRLAGTVIGVMAVCVGPFLVRDARSVVLNTIRFPLGLAHVVSAASSPLPGHLIAQTGHFGHTLVVVLLIASVAGVGISLIVRPPRTVPAATIRLIVALTLMFVLAPSTRWGYFIYPGGLLVWLLICRAGRAVSRLEWGSCALDR